MNVLLNLLWFLLGGWLIAAGYLFASLLLMLTIIGIPFGIQTLKLGMVALWPFGQEIKTTASDGGCLSILMNVIWILCGGIWIAATHLLTGAFALYHGYRHTFRVAALQDGRAGLNTVWKDIRIGIETELHNL